MSNARTTTPGVAASAETRVIPGVRTPTILVVDDSDEIRSMFVGILGEAGFNVTGAATGTEGLERALEQPDLIILDISLPELDGRAVCRQLKADPRTAAIPILMLSGVYCEVEDRTQALEDGSDGYLTKPVTPQELIATSRAILRMRGAERRSEELRQAQERLERNQARLVQTERLRALGEMAAGVAHDFNNVLTIILGRTELLLRRAQDPDLVHGLNVVRNAAQDGADTVRRIQEFTRTRRTRPFGAVNVVEVISEVIELTRPRWKDEAQSRGVRYDVRVDGEAPPVLGRPEELREVFMNLLVNALDAMPAGGSCAFRARAEGDRVIIEAQDTGCGMSEETRRRVFEPFFTTKGPRGNGLGLAVIWGILQRHQGTIEVASTLGRGSTFTITLPAASEASVPDTPEAPSPGVPGARILVIEDEPEVRTVLGELLSDAGYVVVQAGDGAEGLRRFEQELFDLVISDVSMPGLSGWDVAAGCRAQAPDCPIGLVTGWGDQLDSDLVARLGITFVIAKPFAVTDVLRQVAEALRAPVSR